MNLFDYENIKHVGSIKSYELQLSFLRFNTALQIAKCEPLSRAVSHESSIIIIIIIIIIITIIIIIIFSLLLLLLY